MLLITRELNEKKYSIPKNVPPTTASKYFEVITRGYAKYLDAIAMCGNFCMVDQFRKLFEVLNKEKEYKDSSIRKYTTTIIRRLEELDFIGTDYLSKYKYIYLRQPAFAFHEGDYINSRRLNMKNEMKTDKFLTSLIKIEFLIDSGTSYSHENLNKQLLDITKMVLDIILESGNKYKFDTTTIRRIIEVGEYDKIKNIIINTRENNTRLGILRFIWGEIGREYKKLGMQGQTISNTPYHLKLNLLDDGSITLHYAPIIIIFDTSRDLEYYSLQSNKYFHTMFNLKGNTTHKIRDNFKNSRTFEYPHFNRVGYTVKVIGFDNALLEKKINILNLPYYSNNEYSPLIAPCESVFVDINNYLKYSSNNYSKDDYFVDINKTIDDMAVNKVNSKDILI